MIGDFQFLKFPAWLGSITGFYRLVFSRRQDQRAGLVPIGYGFVAYVFVGLVSIVAIHLAFDDVFLNWVKGGETQRSGFFASITHLGETKWVLTMLGCQLLAMSFAPVVQQRREKFLDWYQWMLTLYFLFSTIIFSGLLSTMLKNLIGRARPVVAEVGEVLYLEPFGGHYEFASFPSGHSTTAGAVLVSCLLLFPRIAPLVVPVCLLVAVSRCVIGVHFPSDVVGGLLLGTVFTWIYARSFARHRMLFQFNVDGRLISPRYRKVTS